MIRLKRWLPYCVVVILAALLFIPLYSLSRPHTSTLVIVVLVVASCVAIAWAILHRKFDVSLREQSLRMIRMSFMVSLVLNTLVAFLYVGAKQQTASFDTHQLEWVSVCAVIITLYGLVDTHAFQERTSVVMERAFLMASLFFFAGFMLIRHIKEWSWVGLCLAVGAIFFAGSLFFIQQKIGFLVAKWEIPVTFLFIGTLVAATLLLSGSFFNGTSIWLVPALLLVAFIGGIGFIMWQIQLTYVSTVWLELLYGISLICLVCTLTVFYYTGSLLTCIAACIAALYTFFFLHEW